MAALEELCLSYIHENIDSVLKVPIDMSCLSEGLVNKLTKIFTVDKMQAVHDPQDKIISQLYFGKLTDLLSGNAPDTAIASCCLCGSLYARSQEARLICESAPMRIGRNGSVTRPHERWAASTESSLGRMSTRLLKAILEILDLT
ncbi:hypothetical protein HKX48_000942 [Thoreauomyces humboldtii]|nr:hypothetical protein HKX48_000942 [Thoreauomyces humboldtii]